MKAFLCVVLLALTAPAVADIASGLPVFTWTQPATWTDGAPLTAAQITGYQLACTGATTRNARIAAASGVPPYVVPTVDRFAAGAYACTLAVYARQTATAPEAISAASAPVNFTVPQAKPTAATGLSVE